RLNGGPARVAGHSERTVGCAMIAAVLRENFRPARHHPRENEGKIVGFAAAVDEQALVKIPGGTLRESLRQSDPLLGDELRRDAASSFGLFLDSLNDAPVSVAEVTVEELRQEIQVSPALAVVKVYPFPTVELR